MAKRKNEPIIAAAPAAADAKRGERVRRQRQQAAASLEAVGKASGNAYVLRPGKTKGRAEYGHRRSICLQEWAQSAIIALYPNALPILTRSHDRSHALLVNQINQTHLPERVNDYLKKLAKQDHADAKKYRDSGYAGEKISRQTVGRALKTLQDANG